MSHKQGKGAHYTCPAAGLRCARYNPTICMAVLPTSPTPSPRSQSGLAGAADALYLAELARQAAPLVVVCASAWDANRLTEELRWFDPGIAGLRLSRLGNPALRHVFAAPGPDFGAAGDAVPDFARRVRHRRGGAVHRAVPAGAAGVSGRPHLFPQAEGHARRSRLPRADGAGRLHPRQSGVRAGRVFDPRRPDRPVPHGQRPALPHRPVRQRNRDAARVRRRHPAQHLSGERSAAAARARIPARRGRHHPLPAEFPRALRGRPVEVQAVQGRQQRPRAGRHRVLPAAVFRRNGDAVRLPARADHTGQPRRARPRRPGILGRRAKPLPPAVGRQGPPAAAARRAVSADRCLFQPGQGLRPARCRTDRRAGWPASGSAHFGRPPRGAPGRQAAGLHRRLQGQGADRRAVGRAARNPARIPRRARHSTPRCATAGPTASSAPSAFCSRTARSPKASSAATASSPSSPKPSSTPSRRRPGARARPARRRSTTCCATCPS